MLGIRDEQVRALAEAVMEKRGAPNLTAAIRLALENEITRSDTEPSLREKIDELRRKVLGTSKIAPDRNAKDSRDDLWDR